MSDDARTRERKQKVVEALGGVLEDGEVFVVARDDDQIVAVPVEGPARGGAPRLAARDPDLYGRLVGLNTRLDDPPGSFIGVLIIVAAIAACVALAADVALPLLGPEINEGLRSAWAWAGIIVLAAIVHFMIKAVLRRLAWLGGQGEVGKVLRAAGLTRAELLAELRSDDKLEQVKTFLGKSGDRKD